MFENNQTKTVFVSVDNIGMLIEDTIIIREQVAHELNVPFKNITVVYTHNHSGPETVGDDQLIKFYKTILINNVVKRAIIANDNMQLSEVGWNVTMGEIGVNRRERTSIPELEEIKRIALLAQKQWGVNTDQWLSVVAKHKENIKQLAIDLKIQLFQINDGSFSGIPMEPFSETALAIKENLNNELAFFGGYTNSYLGYLPTKEEYIYGGYEVELNPVVYGPSTNLLMPQEENTAELIVSKVMKLYSN